MIDPVTLPCNKARRSRRAQAASRARSRRSPEYAARDGLEPAPLPPRQLKVLNASYSVGVHGKLLHIPSYGLCSAPFDFILSMTCSMCILLPASHPSCLFCHAGRSPPWLLVRRVDVRAPEDLPGLPVPGAGPHCKALADGVAGVEHVS
ncbi:MAG: hypothetical protein MPJ22_00645 [Pirellulales bacterium]|nr:hypothetical protein [Pirellulales bacterium]